MGGVVCQLCNNRAGWGRTEEGHSVSKCVAVCRVAVKSVAIRGARGHKLTDKEGAEAMEQSGLGTGYEDEARKQR